MAPSVLLLIDPRQKLQTAAMLHLQIFMKGRFNLLKVNSHCPQSEKNNLFLQSGFWSYFLKPQDRLNHHPETIIAVDAV